MLIAHRELEVAGRPVTLLGTRIVTADALRDLEQQLTASAPDAVVVDFDATRWRWLEMIRSGEQMDLVGVIRNKQMSELNARLAHGVFDKVTAPRSGVTQNAEWVATHERAAALGAPVVFGRRPAEQELMRAWRTASFGGRAKLVWRLLKGTLRRTQLDPETLDHEAFDPHSASADARDTAGAAAPILYDEAVLWLARTVATTEATRITVVTSEASFDALCAAFELPAIGDGATVVPPKSLLSRVLPWIITALILTAFILGFVFADPSKMEAAVVAWFVSNMSFAGFGAALALAHPLAILATAVSSPFVSLNPAIGAGMVGALVQAFVAPPTVADMDRVGDDITKLSGWWRNRLARIVLILILANGFSSIGTFVALAWFPT